MSNNINYSIQTADSGAVVMRSNIKSFNLDHVTDKDIVSFYRNFSSFAMFDTGLMPNSATGVLAIRSAGNHTQITFQHQPQINYINWGASEGDRDAKTYLVAQPYRIWIGDLVDGDMFGARMFYSPYPITSPDQQLYHLNLPNTNCKGYRGNGVGWQCLYHKESWQQLPFNEKIIRFAERCSGVETYNDANMSETDGPRFYQENSFPSYVWDPTAWQEKTSTDGLDWVLDPSQWMPIFVKDQDHQDRHYYDTADGSNAVPLTIQMAMLGDYQGYYTDNIRPKPINSLTRSDLKLQAKSVVNWIARGHNSSSEADVAYNPMEEASSLRVKITSAPVMGGHDVDDEDEEFANHTTITCPISGEPCSCDQSETSHDKSGNVYCEPCFSENAVYCENNDEYLHPESEFLYYDDKKGIHIDTSCVDSATCTNCGTYHWVSSNDKISVLPIYTSEQGQEICVDCIKDYVTDLSIPHALCSACHDSIIITNIDWQDNFNSPLEEIIIQFNGFDLDADNPSFQLPTIETSQKYFCKSCAGTHTLCPTGHYVHLYKEGMIQLPKSYQVDVFDKQSSSFISTHVTHLCQSCCDSAFTSGDVSIEDLMSLSDPFNDTPELLTKNRYVQSVLSGLIYHTPYASIGNIPIQQSNEEPF